MHNNLSILNCLTWHAAPSLPPAEVYGPVTRMQTAQESSSDEDDESLEVEAGVPLLPWNILVTWPPGTI